MLPVIMGTWLFICLVYLPYLIGWANYVTGQKDLTDSVIEGLFATKEQLVPALLITPVVAMHLLGKHAHAKFKFYSALECRLSRSRKRQTRLPAP